MGMNEISEEITWKGEQWLEENPGRGVPHSMTVGYWNSLQFFLLRIGFRIVRCDDESE